MLIIYFIVIDSHHKQVCT